MAGWSEERMERRIERCLTRPKGLECAPMGPSRQRSLAGMEEWKNSGVGGGEGFVSVSGFYS